MKELIIAMILFVAFCTLARSDWLTRKVCARRGHVKEFDCGGNYFGCHCGQEEGL